MIIILTSVSIQTIFASAFLKNNCTSFLLMTISSMMPLQIYDRFSDFTRFQILGLFFLGEECS